MGADRKSKSDVGTERESDLFSLKFTSVAVRIITFTDVIKCQESHAGIMSRKINIRTLPITLSLSCFYPHQG